MRRRLANNNRHLMFIAIIGASLVLFPIVMALTISNMRQEERRNTQLLVEKGAALIRSFEAATRTGMRSAMRGFQLQILLSETADQKDIVHILVTDDVGNIVAHNDVSKIGSAYDPDLDYARLSEGDVLQWRIQAQGSDQPVFEIYRRFTPLHHPHRKMRNMMLGQGGRAFEDKNPADPKTKQVIFVGLDMASIRLAKTAAVKNAVILGVVLLILGFTGFYFLFFIQDYRTTQTALKRIKAFSDNVADKMPMGLVALDHTGRIMNWNQQSEQFFGHSAEKALGQKAKDVLPTEIIKAMEMALKTDKTAGIELDCLRIDGTRIPLEVGISRFEDESGGSGGVIVILRDLREIRHLRQEVARHQRFASLGRLAAGVAHEIRNPLSSIKGFAVYFKERYKDIDQDRETAEIMVQEVERLNRVITQLLEFSRPISVSPRKIQVQGLVEDAFKLVEQQAKENNVHLQYQGTGTPEEVLVDPDQMRQVLLNLLLNALEAMPKGGQINVSSQKGKAKNLEIVISDTGEGIRPEDLAQVFDPYFTTKSTGTGLGLAIVHNIVEAMDGNVQVLSQIGTGTTFTIQLPKSL
ncbi:ATP-binding protein [Desulfobacterales bacterium HSG17]|nr:ATP-binding protein [Desulfobacterales bacterium HSG17]